MPLLMVANSLLASTTDYMERRTGLPNARRVFERTGHGRVAFLGGSITYGPGWRDRVCADLQRRFPRTAFEFLNAGIPSTGSVPGAFRLTRDVFSGGRVDLLFEEAAVNDATNGRPPEQQVRGMEGIVRHARALNPNIDIVLLHFVDPDKMRDYNRGIVPEVIQNHERVAAHYGIASINLALEVTERIQRGEFTWEEDFRDLHPSPFGHRLYADAIRRLCDAVWSGPVSSAGPLPHTQPERLDPYCYDRGCLVPPHMAHGLAGFAWHPRWENTVGGNARPGFVAVPMLLGETPGDRFALRFTGSAVGLFVAAGPDAGCIDYRVDEGGWETRDLYTQWSGGLHIPWLYLLAEELDENCAHLLEVRIAEARHPLSKGHACRVVHFALNRSLPSTA